ncbi:MAG: outer membrane beta-barrel protein [Bryobacteraceae bacterium]
MKTLRALSVSVVLIVGCAEAQQAQQNAPQDTQQPPPPAPAPSPGTTSSSSSSSAPAAPSERRFSGGVTLSVLGLNLISGASNTVNNTTEISTEYQTTGASSRIGYGLTIQARITNHFYLNLSGLLRRMGYQETTTVSTTVTAVLNGSTYPSTTTTSTHEDTRTRLIDVPVLLRYYGTGKRPSSPRWFLEGGGTWRLANDIRTSIDSTDANGNVTCCTTTPAVPNHRSAIGATVGAGIQFTDEFGIKVVPEVRYTRWTERIFDNLTTRTQANQVEGDISLTF